jgi:hypothetical protein
VFRICVPQACVCSAEQVAAQDLFAVGLIPTAREAVEVAQVAEGRLIGLYRGYNIGSSLESTFCVRAARACVLLKFTTPTERISQSFLWLHRLCERSDEK